MRTQRIRIDASLDDTHATLYNVRGEVIARVPRDDLQATKRRHDDSISLDPNDPWTPAINRMAASNEAKPIQKAVTPWERKIGVWMTCLNTRWKSQPRRTTPGYERKPLTTDWPSAIDRMIRTSKAKRDATNKGGSWMRWCSTVAANHNHRAKAREQQRGEHH